MAEFVYNNSKNVSLGHTFFELNYSYHSCVFFKNKCNTCSRSSSAKRLAMELKKLMNVCCQNLLYAQDLQKQAHNKGMKPQSYVLGEKVWLNNKHIKTKKNKKLEAKFFRPFQVLHLVGKQAYKLELLARWKIHNIFYMLLLE